MKTMVKRVLGCLLALVLLCGMIPLAASAETITTLTDVNITVDTPMAGREADFTVHPMSYPVYGVRAYTEQTLFADYHHGVGWYDETAGRYLNEGECYVLGHSYTFNIYMTVNNPAYYKFATNLTVSVNGQFETITKSRDLYNCHYTYSFGACEEAPAAIDEVALGGIVYPVAGEHPVFDIAFDEELFSRDDYAGGAFIHGVAWYDSESFFILDEDDVFQEGRRYTVSVQLLANDPYRFATSGGNSTVKTTINGFEMTNISHEEGNPERVLKVKYSFTCASADSVGGGENEIYVKIDYPISGQLLSHAPEIFGTDIEYSGYTNQADGFYDGVQWYNRTTDAVVPTNIYAKKGSSYSVAVLVDCKSVIDPNTWLSYIDNGDGTCISHVKATVNGLPARVEPFGDLDMAQTVKIIYDFPACGNERLVINDITLSDVQPPVVGEYPDGYGTLTYRYQGSPTVSKQSIPLNWIEIGTAGDTRTMAVGDRFLLNCQYGVMLEFSAGPLQDFLMEDGTYNGTLTAKGSVMTETYTLSSKTLMLAALYATLDKHPDAISSFDIVGLVPPEAGDRPCTTATFAADDLGKVQIDSIEWETKDGTKLTDSDTFQVGTQYVAYVRVSPVYPYTEIVDKPTVTVNGSSDPYSGLDDSGFVVNGKGSYATVAMLFDAVKATNSLSVVDYADAEEVMRPAPGQRPDFTASIESAYTQFGGITWCELDENGAVVGTLEPSDTFKKDTVYRLEVRLTAPAGRKISLDNRTNYLNGEPTDYYYLSDTAVVLYAEYDTANCITELNLGDIQYPIPGKTPDTNVVFTEGQENTISTIPYTGDTDIDWYYETNPGTAVAGFSRLDGKFKADRRHQAYVQLQTDNDAWFATDNEGNLAVNITFDRKTIDFCYTIDTDLADGAVNSLEAARTYERASTVDGVFIDGMWLTDGVYLDSDHWGVQTEETVDKEAGYAYYENGVLTLHDFNWTTQGDYNGIDSYKPLTICAEGETYLESYSNGIATNDTLTLEGDGKVEVYSNSEGIFAMGDVTVESGIWTVEDAKYDGLWLYSSLTVNGGTLDVYGPQCGINGDDFPPVTVNGGTLIARAAVDCAIGWCDTEIADGAKVTVGTYDSDTPAPWDGVTDFAEYAYVKIAFESDVLLGDVNLDGTVNMRVVLRLYQHINGNAALTDAQALTAADMDGNHAVNMRDALALFQKVSGR